MSLLNLPLNVLDQELVKWLDFPSLKALSQTCFFLKVVLTKPLKIMKEKIFIGFLNHHTMINWKSYPFIFTKMTKLPAKFHWYSIISNSDKIVIFDEMPLGSLDVFNNKLWAITKNSVKFRKEFLPKEFPYYNDLEFENPSETFVRTVYLAKNSDMKLFWFLELLLSKGANINARIAYDDIFIQKMPDRKYSALEISWFYHLWTVRKNLIFNSESYFDTIKYFISKINPKYRPVYFYNPLIHWLLEHGAQDINNVMLK
jgi:hypothetical protein